MEAAFELAVTLNMLISIVLMSTYLRLKQVNLLFRLFVLFRSFMSCENELPIGQNLIMKGYFFLKHLTLSAQATYGLDTSNVLIEDVPLVLARPKSIRLERIPSELQQPVS